MASGSGWYEVVAGHQGLEQGDILLGCPVILPAPELTFPISNDRISAVIQEYDVVITSQSCDIANGKIDDVILCPHWDLGAATTMDPSLGRSGILDGIRKGRMPRYILLDASELEIAMGVRLVDLGKVLSLPKSFVGNFARAQGKRLRLISPYRESLAQRFGQFFSRIALPHEVGL